MRSKIITLALIAGLGSAAFAATDTAGTIKAIDTKTLTVTLADGSSYHLPAGFDAKAFTVGEKVVISWEAKGDLKDVMGMKAG
jgi:hypothetical protein